MGLVAVVQAGLRTLDDLRVPCREVTSGDLERALRVAVERYEQDGAVPTVSAADSAAGPVAAPDRLTRVAIAVRVACAHLGAGNLVEARLALHDAHDALPHRDRRDADAAGAAVEQARDAVGRRLGDRAVLAQAVGILTERTGTAPTPALAALHRYAERHRFVVSELASDVVAGRVAPGAVVARARRRRGSRTVPAQPA